LAHGLPAEALAHGLPAEALAHGLPAEALAHGLPAEALAEAGIIVRLGARLFRRRTKLVQDARSFDVVTS
jgi:hypothetical protein